MALEKNDRYAATPEVAKYRKKKNKKTIKKADHKHVAKNIMFRDLSSKYGHICRGEYCEICGKILNYWYFESKKTETHSRVMMSQEEVIDKYKDLKIVDVNNVYRDKFIDLNKIKDQE